MHIAGIDPQFWTPGGMRSPEEGMVLSMSQEGRSPKTKTLWIRQEYLEQILAGLKDIEVRVAYENLKRLQAGDILLLNGQHPYAIVRITAYPDFEALLRSEDASRIAPDLPAGELLPALRRLYPPEKEALGVLAIEIRPVSTS